jgi:type I restriction enzyme, S subunit
MKSSDFYKKTAPSVSIAKIIFYHLAQKFKVDKISNIAKTTSGGTPNRGNPTYYGGDIAWIKSGELNDGLITSFEETITEEGLKNSSAKVYPKGSLVLALYGATAGKTGVLDFEAASNQAVAAIFPNDDVERDYLFWFFRQKRLDYIEMSFGAAQPNISQNIVKATDVPMPSKEIQKSIVSFLDNYEKTKILSFSGFLLEIEPKVKRFDFIQKSLKKTEIEANNRKALFLQLRQSILQEAVEGKITEKWRNTEGVAIEPASLLLDRIKTEKAKTGKKEKPLLPILPEYVPFELPKGWIWCRSGYVADFIDPQPSHRTPPEYPNGVPYIGMTEVQQNGIINFSIARKVSPAVLKEHQERYILKDGDFIFGKIGTIGKPTFLPTPYNYTLSANIILIQPNNDIIYSKYLSFYLQAPLTVSYLKDDSTSSTHLVFGIKKARDMMIPLPPLKEQCAIVEKVEKLLQKVQALEAAHAAQVADTEGLWQTMLREVFEG